MLSWLLFVLPLVTLIWIWDVAREMIGVVCLKYYCYAFKRSSYLQERCIVDTIYKQYTNSVDKRHESLNMYN